jgi:hypothetical protein
VTQRYISITAQHISGTDNVKWTTISESELKTFDLYRSSDLALWTLVVQKPSISNCAAINYGSTYNYLDSNIVATRRTITS